MPITLLTTNIFQSPAQTLVNPVNTVGVMGKGLALAFKQRYPQMYQEYRHLCKTGQLTIGDLHVYHTVDKTIINFPTKEHWRNPSKLSYIEAGLQKFVATYQEYNLGSVAFPQLGCGYGGLHWEKEVKPLMESYLQDIAIPVYIHIFKK